MGTRLMFTALSPLRARPKELMQTFEEGPPKAALEVIIFFQLFFPLPLLIVARTCPLS